jgi:carboxyl-terminal processing protease
MGGGGALRRAVRAALLGTAALAALGGAFTIGYRLHHAAPAAQPRSAPAVHALRSEILSELRASWYRPLPARALRARSVQALMAALGDPYSAYLSPRAYRNLRRSEAAAYAGVGVALDRAQQGLIVRASLPGFPAHQAGIEPGDVITSIDGTSLASLPYDRALDMLHGRVGTRIQLRVLRPGRPEPVQVTLVRRPIDVPAVSSRWLHRAGHKLIYVRLIGFPHRTAARVRSVVGQAVRSGGRGVVIDLRDNPGGLLSEAVDVARVFVSRGVIVSTRGLHEREQVFRATGSALKLPVVILIDRGTASAAEVLAGALQQARRATVVGTASYGKGTVQSVQPLSNGGALKLTVARFWLRGGVAVNGRGVHPSVTAYDRPDTAADEGLAAAVRALAPR